MRNTNDVQEKVHIAINTHLLLALILFFIFVGISISSATQHEIGLCIGFAVVACIPILVCLISPLYCVFSSQEVMIVYTLGQKEIIPWRAIRSISHTGGWIVGVGLPRYVISYPKTKKSQFYVCGEIPKTRKTNKLIKKYYRKEIV